MCGGVCVFIGVCAARITYLSITENETVLTLVPCLNVYCPECPPGGYNWTPGWTAYRTSLFRIGPR